MGVVETGMWVWLRQGCGCGWDRGVGVVGTGDVVIEQWCTSALLYLY